MELEQPPTEQPLKTVEDAQREIDALFGQYETVAEETIKPDAIPVVETQPVSPGISQPVSPGFSSPPIPGADADAPYGRYVKGKKAGQPRPKPRQYYGQQPVVQQLPAAPPKLSGMLIDGGLFLTLVNLVIPMLICVGNNYFSDKKIKPEKIQLSKEQLRELDPVCDAVMKQVSMTGNPMLLLFIGLFAAYGLNFMAVKIETK